jgi:hypothetical protein
MNVIPIGNGWKSFPDLSPAAVALPAKCVGGCFYRSSSGNFVVIAGTATKLYRMDVSSVPFTWVDISSGQTFAVPTDQYWQFERFGTKLYACSLGAPLQVLDVDVGAPAFTVAPGSPPSSKFLRTIGDFLVLAYLKVGAAEFPTKWINSGINDAGVWTVGTKLCDEQVMPDGDEISGLLGGIGGGRILQHSAKRKLVLTPDVNMTIKSVDIDKGHGTIAPYGTIPLPGDTYVCLEEDGFFVGDERRAISVEKVSRTFFEDCPRPEIIQGVADPNQHIAWWRYIDNDNRVRMLGWDWDTDRWTQADPDVEYLFSAVTAAVSLENLTTLFLQLFGSSSMDTPGIESLDSLRWKGGQPMLASFTSTHRLAAFTGQSREATIDTTVGMLSGMLRSKVTGCTPIADSTAWRVAMAIGMRPGDVGTMSFGPFGVQNRVGRCPVRGNGRMVRFRAVAPAGTVWDHFHGIDPILHPGGAG